MMFLHFYLLKNDSIGIIHFSNTDREIHHRERDDCYNIITGINIRYIL